MESSFYLLKGVVLVILFCNFWGMNVGSIFPCVIAFRVPLPLDEVLEAF